MSVRWQHRRARHREAGFTLLEAIVALVIMATTLLALYSWLSSSAIGAGRAAQAAASLADAKTALAYVERVNPMSDPDGSTTIEGLKVTWHAEPVTDRRTGRTLTGEPSPYDLQLYELRVDIARNGQTTRTFNLRKAGWVATRVVDPNEM